MNKNTLFAFVLIVFTVIFFNSSLWNNFWYGTVLKRPVPTSQPRRQQQPPPPPSTDAKTAAPEARPSDGADIGTDTNGVDETVIAAPQIVEDTIWMETDKLRAGISTRGARIVSLKMAGYEYSAGRRKGELIDLIPVGSIGGAQLSVNDESFDDLFFSAAKSGNTAIFEAKSRSGDIVRKTFTFGDGYRINYAVSGNAIAGKNLTKGWLGGIEDTESGAGIPFGGGLDKRRAHYSDVNRVYHFEMKKSDRQSPMVGSFRWVGMSSKYFFVALVAQDTSDADVKIEGRPVRAPQGSEDINYSIYYQAPATSNNVESWIYAGPNFIKELSSHGVKFEKTLFPVISWARHIFWADVWFPPLAEIILKVLLFLYNLVKDYGIAIFLLTLLSKVITFPMTQSSTKSMMKMRDLQPKLKALQQKYKGNTQKLNQEVMALYKTEGVNPFNPGCLPMFLQMPIFIALFVVLRKAIELRGASSFLLPWVKDLSLPEALFHLPFNIPIYGSNVALLPILMAAVTFYQQKQTITDPNQKALIYMMPIIMLVMFNGFPAGVVFYWTVSSALGLVQQMWLKPKPKQTQEATGGATATVTTSSGTQKVPVKKAGGSSSAGGGKRKRR